MSRFDPLSKTYYKSMKSAEFWVDLMFYLAALLSIFALVVDKKDNAFVYDVIQGLFALTVVFMFVGSSAIRLYWSSRAHEKRIADFVSNSFDVSLIYETSSGYYNNDECGPFRRIAAALLENTFHTKEITRLMLRGERLRIACYAFVWLVAVLNRATDLALIAAAAQVVFSEQLISRWIRLEWLRSRVEKIYDNLYILIQSTSQYDSKNFSARCLELFVLYESAKSKAGVSLSSRIFNKNDTEFAKQWVSIKGRIAIK